MALEWKRMGHHVEVVTQYPSYPQGYVFEHYCNEGFIDEDWGGITIHRFPVIQGYRDSKWRKFANYLKFVQDGKKITKKIGGGFDVIFVSQTGPLTVTLPAISAGKKHKIPVAVWTQDIWPDVVWTYGIPQVKPIEWLLDKFIAYVYNKCDRIFVSSKRFEDVIQRYSSKEIIYTPNWLRPTEEVESDLKLDKGKFNFTFTGNISRYQNLINTVVGFGKASLEDAVLNIVGDGSYANEVRKVVEKQGIKNVVFHGRKPYNQMNDILVQSDALVLPLINHEGIMKTEPFKIQSYLHAGKPIMGVLGGSGREIIEENKLGLVARPDDVDDIARVFTEMTRFAKEQSAEIKNRAALLMHTRFNKETIVKTFTDNLPFKG